MVAEFFKSSQKNSILKSNDIRNPQKFDFVPNVTQILSIIKVRLWKQVDVSRILQETSYNCIMKIRGYYVR